MTETMNALAVRAVDLPECREQLIMENEQVILRTASRLCRRYISKSDDEWSISLGAFSRAVDIYSIAKGDFLPFAQMLIKRSLTDYYRTQSGARREICVSPHIFDQGAENGEDSLTEGEGAFVSEGVRTAVEKSSVQEADNAIQLEILAANEMLEKYGFRFFDLVSCSPKQDRSRQDCAAAVRAAMQDPGLCDKLRRTRRLPVRELCKASNVSRKSIDRYRKYIIMAILILEGDYPLLSEYLRFIREDPGKPCGTRSKTDQNPGIL